MRSRTNVNRWHSWFAWRPVRTENGVQAWLEIIQRKLVLGKWKYRIRPPVSKGS